MPADSDADLTTARKSHRDELVSRTPVDVARKALDRIIVLELIGDNELAAACEGHLRTKFRVPRDHVSDVVNRLHKKIKEAKSNRTDAVPVMRTVLKDASPVSLRPGGYILRGIEPALIAKLTDRNCLLLSGPPRCGKSDTARWVAAQFEQLGYDVQQGSDLETASRFLLDPGAAERLFLLDDPLGGAHLDPGASRTLELLATLLSRLSSQKKIIIAQSQDAIFHASGRTEFQTCTVFGNGWIDLGEYPPAFLENLWIQMAMRANTPPSLRARMADALATGKRDIEPGCLQHLALSAGLSDDLSLDQAVRLAREPARSLGQALPMHASMADLLAALAIGSAPNALIEKRELAFAMDRSPTKLPGKVSALFPAVQLGGTRPVKVTPAYDRVFALEREAEVDLETLERRGIVRTPNSQIAFSHPYYRAAAASVLDAPTARMAAQAVRAAERGLFCLSSETSRATARNLDWLYRALANRADAQDSLISICVEGLHSIFPTTRDLCFAFLVRHLADLTDRLRDELPGWVRTIARTDLNDIRWRDGEAVFPSEHAIDGGEHILRSLRRVRKTDVSADLEILERETASYLSPERAAEVLTYLKREPDSLSVRAMGRLLSYDEAVLRAEAARIWLLRNRSNDLIVISRILEDENPTVILGAFLGAGLGWSKILPDRQATILQQLKLVAANPFAALLLLDRLVVFNRVELMGENPPWPVFGALMPIVLETLPADANISEVRLYAAMRDACEHLSVEAVIPILSSWTSWIERELARGILPDEFALSVPDVLLDVTGTRADLRRALVNRLFALPGTGAAMAMIRDFVDAWPSLDRAERAQITDALTRDRQDRRWLQAVALTRNVVPSELQDLILGSASALSDDASSLIRTVPPDILDAAVSVYCGRPQPLWWLGTHHKGETVWKNVVQQIALRPDHNKFEIALANIIFEQKGEPVAKIVETVGPEHIEKLFEILLRQRTKENGNYLSEAWSALFKRAKDTETKTAWLERIVLIAPVMLDDLDEIDRWLTEQEREELLARFKSDTNPLLLLHQLRELPPDDVQDMKDDTVAALKALVTRMPPRLYGTYDRIRRSCETLGLENDELTALLKDARAKIFKERKKHDDDSREVDALPKGWIAP
ncbi:DNA polymerase III delta prime subunit [Bradyrhizobium sp. LA6.10]|uniref:nSTAND3 domain-containing NTPase n=1 Tax=Bradyrhizobium sp. LA6.10 TaxID=3156318 RepID=UPI003397D6FA